jgi:hypothetical protein
MLGQDIRWAVQTLRRNLGLTTVLVLSLGLAIGANTAVFSVVNAFLIRPLGIQDIDRVVRVYENYAPPGQPPETASVAGANYYQWLVDNQVFEGIAAGTFRHLNLTGTGDPERIAGAAITWNFFPVLGIEPVLGRNFLPEEDKPGTRHVVLLGYGYWNSRFGGDRKVLGKILTLNGEPYEVIGVMPRGLRHPYNADMWVPLALESPQTNGWGHYVPARLKPGISLERGQEEMTALVRRLAGGNPAIGMTQGVQLAPLRDELIRDLPRLLLLLLVAAALLLLIACVNVSNLLLAQSLNQSTEVAVRVALGATRGRLLRQFFTYSVLLALLGGAVGLLLTFIRPAGGQRVRHRAPGRPADAWLHLPDLSRGGPPFRPGAGVAGVQVQRQRQPQGGGPVGEPGHRRPACPRRLRRRRGGSRPGAAGGRRPHLPEHAAGGRGGPRLRHEERPGVRGGVARAEVPRPAAQDRLHPPVGRAPARHLRRYGGRRHDDAAAVSRQLHFAVQPRG